MSAGLAAGTGLDGLVTLVRECAASGVGRRALLLRTDLLPPALSRPHHLRLAQAALDPLTAADRARKHELPGGRVVVSWRGESRALLQQTLAALETLLQDTPLDAPGVPELVGLYDLPRDGAALLRSAGVAAPAPDTPVPDAEAPAVAAAVVLQPLDAKSLTLLEERLAGADMARFARRTPVCRLGSSGMQLAWEQRVLSVAELTEAVVPGRSADSDPWLLRRLTRLLDRRMLALLSHPDELRTAGPFSLGLNVATLLGPDFLRFDTALPRHLRGRVVIDMSPADVLSDPPAFVFARGFARSRGYRICLRGVTAAMLPLLRLTALDVDYVQLSWSPQLARLGSADLRPGPARWVLGDAQPQAAREWGIGAGIGLFAGATAMRDEHGGPPGQRRQYSSPR